MPRSKGNSQPRWGVGGIGVKKILGVCQRKSDTIWSGTTQGARAVVRVSSREPGLPRVGQWGARGQGLWCGEGWGCCGDCEGHSRWGKRDPVGSCMGESGAAATAVTVESSLGNILEAGVPDAAEQGRSTTPQAHQCLPRHSGWSTSMESLCVCEGLCLLANTSVRTVSPAGHLHHPCRPCLPAGHHMPLGERASHPTLRQCCPLYLGEVPGWAEAGGFCGIRGGWEGWARAGLLD